MQMQLRYGLYILYYSYPSLPTETDISYRLTYAPEIDVEIYPPVIQMKRQ